MFNFFITQLKSQFNIKRLIRIQIALLGLIALLFLSNINLSAAFINQQKLVLGLVNQDDNPLIHVLIDSFKNNDAFTAQFDIVVDDKPTITKKFDAQIVDAYIVIPDGFTESVMGYKAQSLSLYTRSGYPTQRELLKGIFITYIDYVKLSNAAAITLYQHLSSNHLSDDELKTINRAFSFKIVQTAMARQSLFNQHPTDEMANANSKIYYTLMLALALINFLLIALTAQNLAFIKQKLSARISLTQLSFNQYLVTIHAAQCAIAIVSVISIVLFMMISMKIDVAKLIICVVILSLFWSNFLLILALISQSPQQFTTIALPLTIISMTISGTFTPYALLPQHLKYLATLTPQFNAAAFVLNFPAFNWGYSILYIALIILMYRLQMYLLPLKIKREL